MELGLWLIAAVAAAFVLDRLMLKAEERGWIYWRKRKGSHGMAVQGS